MKFPHLQGSTALDLPCRKKEELFNLPEEVQWSLMLGLVDSSRHYHYVAFIILIMMVMSEAIAPDDAPVMPRMMLQTYPRHVPDDAPDMSQMMPQTCLR